MITTGERIFLTLLVSLPVLIIFLLGMGIIKCGKDDDRRIKCKNAGGVYTEFHGSKDICFSPSAILPI